ncbi:MAG: ABC transporter ATP-binding protein [Betaproteobacteria bacterium RIFCSPLOWO2_12_FULL_62_13]|nr:MAG: ABC transporter ATP-binding protein [Betaproteobacteria bacterium RIFCSPLOWO2_12_FULL_62_13]
MLELVDLHVRYGHVHALNGVSLSVPAGGIYAVLGANGAGKTTLLRSIIGLAGQNSTIRLDGRAIGGLPAFARARLGIALVPEGRRLFPEFSVGENLRIGALQRKDRIEVERDIERVVSIFPVLRERYHQRASTLSGGEGQMVAIGRALMARPKILLLDEPSMGLMPKAVSQIFRIIRSIPSGEVTVLLVEQNARKALAIADRVAVLELGRVVANGAVAELREDPRIKAAYLGGQVDNAEG